MGAVIESLSLFADRDDDIYSNAPDDTGHYSTVQMRSNSNVNAGLFGFDISSIPANSQIREGILNYVFTEHPRSIWGYIVQRVIGQRDLVGTIARRSNLNYWIR